MVAFSVLDLHGSSLEKGRRTQVVKGEVCKTSMQRFESARRLQQARPEILARIYRHRCTARTECVRASLVAVSDFRTLCLGH